METTTSEGWWAPMTILDHATAQAPAIAATPHAGEARTITAAKPKAVAVWPEGKELNPALPIRSWPSFHGP